MSGSYPDTNSADEATTVAAVQSGMVAVVARIDERQAQSVQFMVEHGAAVLDGHTEVSVVPPR